MKERDIRREMIPFLTSLGIRIHDYFHGGKHWKLKLSYKGKRWTENLPVSSSDWRSMRNKKAQIRARIRAL